MAPIAINRDWISSEFLKLVDLERTSATMAKARAEAPPMPALAVLYHEIAEQDERHLAILETIATRYGHTPTRSAGGGVGETLGRIKDRVVAMGAGPTELLRQDLMAKADAIDCQSAWAHAFESIGDAQSARELALVLNEDHAHHNALLEGFKRMLEQRSTETSGR